MHALAALRLDLRVREAELLLKTGSTEDAIEAMSAMLTLDTGNAPRVVVGVQARGLRLLVAALLKLGPSDGEIEMVEQSYKSTFANMHKRAGAEALATLHDGAAALAEARGDLSAASESLRSAVTHLQKAKWEIDGLANKEDRLLGDLAHAVRLGQLFERLAAVVDGEAAIADSVGSSAAKDKPQAEAAASYRAKAVEAIWEEVLLQRVDSTTGSVTADCPLLRSALEFSHGVLRSLAVASLSDRDPEAAEKHARRSLRYAQWLRAHVGGVSTETEASSSSCALGEPACKTPSGVVVESASGAWARVVHSRAEAVLSEIAKQKRLQRWRRLLSRNGERTNQRLDDTALSSGGRWDDLWPPLLDLGTPDASAVPGT